MGIGEKIPECGRPSYDEVHKKLKNSVSDKLTKLFLVDIQNDCACSVERYFIDLKGEVALIEVDGSVIRPNNDFLDLPMLPSISDENIINLLKQAGEHSKTEFFDDLKPAVMIYNPKVYGEKLYHLYKEYVGEPHFFREGGIWNWHEASFIPENEIWFLPDVEFFGVISVNIAGFGAMCIPKNILKKHLD